MTLPSEPNPYESPATPTDVARWRPRLVRNLVILNFLLLLIPGVLMLIGYIALRIELAREAAPLNGDFVTYDHEFVGVSGLTMLPLAVYLVVPNLILICWVTFAARKTRSQAS